MMSIKGRLLSAALALAAAPALAHHSFAMFDARKTITVDAAVTEFQWSNPHSWLELDLMPGQDGATSFHHLSLEMTSISVLRNGGWGPRTLKPGDKVIINGMRKIFFPGQPVKPHVVPMDQPDLPPPGPKSGPAPAG